MSFSDLCLNCHIVMIVNYLIFGLWSKIFLAMVLVMLNFGILIGMVSIKFWHKISQRSYLLFKQVLYLLYLMLLNYFDFCNSNSISLIVAVLLPK